MRIAQIIQYIEADPGLRLVFKEAQSHETNEDADPGHDFSHSLRVALWTLRLGQDSVDSREAIAASLLHDAVNPPKNSAQRVNASVLSGELAAKALPQAGFVADAVNRIVEAIEDHSYSRGMVPRNHLGRVLQDADRLDALGALGVLRTATCGAQMGARYFDLNDPWAKQRTLDDQRFTLDHFFAKLLRLEDTLHTKQGRAEARRRTAFLRAFVRQLGEEIDEQWEE